MWFLRVKGVLDHIISKAEEPLQSGKALVQLQALSGILRVVS